MNFDQRLSKENRVLKKTGTEILQVNVGKLCNLACVHCHVEAGPTKTAENMNLETAEAVVRFMDSSRAHTLDLTGGAPELNPHFKMLVLEGKRRKMRVIDRCNLTVFFEPGQKELPQWLADQGVEIVASMPCYSKENVDKQRGRGAFQGSVEALQILNKLGYGKEGTGLILNLVYNPVGPHLPPNQQKLRDDYKERLLEDFGIVFNELFTIANMPITRYTKYLKAFGQYDAYVQLLLDSFNPGTLDGLMCVNTVSVSWNGKIYDCDFNQMLGMQMQNGKPLTIFNLSEHNLIDKHILTGNHCFGCTAGAGSSCQGSLTEELVA
jgi:radical SAM/Cys-rich protein